MLLTKYLVIQIGVKIIQPYNHSNVIVFLFFWIESFLCLHSKHMISTLITKNIL